MTRIAFAALVLAASTTFALAASDDDLRQQIIGTWGPDAACAGGQVIFSADGNYAVSQPSGFEANGTWTIGDGVLRTVINGGKAQPDATMSIENDVLTLSGEDRGRPLTQQFYRCPA